MVRLLLISKLFNFLIHSFHFSEIPHSKTLWGGGGCTDVSYVLGFNNNIRLQRQVCKKNRLECHLFISCYMLCYKLGFITQLCRILDFDWSITEPNGQFVFSGSNKIIFTMSKFNFECLD